ncbi:MAG: hypothetical protein FJ213_00785 [Ignavibacteria bacterium]|nr:hypothetical protein [Ignavibacteria bacterium]
MKRFLYITIFISFISVLFAGTFLEYFRGKSESERVVLEWKTREEASLKEFTVERKSAVGDYITIGTISPKGSNSLYTFTDETAFKSSSSVYYYRIKILDTDGSYAYSNEITIIHSVSSVKRTWGSIKAMFR